MSDVPPELITDIFTRLPVKSLLRFRSVSKPYRALIDSPKFIKSQLNQSLKSKSHQSIVLSLNDQLYSIDFESLDKPTLLTQLGTFVFGSFNGLLCLKYGYRITLFNPETRMHRRVPMFYTYRPCDYSVYGFGYDHVNDDYKVVWIGMFVNGSKGEFMVYSLKSDSWRKIADFPYYLCSKRLHNVFVNGAVHWLVTEKDGQVFAFAQIVAFDLATEEYQMLPQPELFGMNVLMSLGVLEGKLCINTNFYMDGMDNMGIWVMEQYGVKESWTKLLSVEKPVDPDPDNFSYTEALAYSKDCKKVLLEQEDGKLSWYDPKVKSIKRISIPGLPMFLHAHMCMGSLVRPTSSVRTDATKKKAETKEPKPRRKQGHLAQWLPPQLVYQVLRVRALSNA